MAAATVRRRQTVAEAAARQYRRTAQYRDVGKADLHRTARCVGRGVEYKPLCILDLEGVVVVDANRRTVVAAGGIGVRQRLPIRTRVTADIHVILLVQGWRWFQRHQRRIDFNGIQSNELGHGCRDVRHRHRIETGGKQPCEITRLLIEGSRCRKAVVIQWIGTSSATSRCRRNTDLHGAAGWASCCEEREPIRA